MINKDNIINWFQEEKIEMKERSIEGTAWAFSCEYGGMYINIGVPDSSSFLFINRHINVSDEHIELLKKASNTQQKEFIYNIKHNFLLSSIDYKLNYVDDEPSILSSVNFGDKIFEDGLTKNMLFDKIKKVHFASLLLIEEINNIFK